MLPCRHLGKELQQLFRPFGPDGNPLVLKANSTPTARDLQQDELWKRSMDDIGIRITFRSTKVSAA